MKRSKRIDLSVMRKQPVFRPKLLAVSLALAIAGCSSNEHATVYRTVDECIQDHPSSAHSCQEGYTKAQQEAQRTAPKYQSQRDCEAEFGINQCNRSSSGNWFMPAMAGFVLGNWLSNRNSYYAPTPFFTSYQRGSPLHGKWFDAGGYSYGPSSYSTVSTNKSTYKPKPNVTRTMSRGGFGSVAKAKSAWGSSSRRGGSSSRGGWGG